MDDGPLYGPVRARGEAARQVEAVIACKILNGLLEQGRAESERVV